MMLVVSVVAVSILVFAQRNTAEERQAGVRAGVPGRARRAPCRPGRDGTRPSPSAAGNSRASRASTPRSRTERSTSCIQAPATSSMALTDPDEGGAPGARRHARAHLLPLPRRQGRGDHAGGRQGCRQADAGEESQLALPRSRTGRRSAYVARARYRRRGRRRGDRHADHLHGERRDDRRHRARLPAADSLAAADPGPPAIHGRHMARRQPRPERAAEGRPGTESPASSRAAIAASDGDHGGFEFRALGSPYPPVLQAPEPRLALPARLRGLGPPAGRVALEPAAPGLGVRRGGMLALAGAFFASHFLSRRLSRPVERLAVDSRRTASTGSAPRRPSSRRATSCSARPDFRPTPPTS